MKRHPAKYNDSFLEIFYKYLQASDNVLDPMAGTGKIAKIKDYGYKGIVFANEIEPEWAIQSFENGCDSVSTFDASNLPFPNGFFHAICTSPTYGNRMADSHIARDTSKRNTYTHTIGRKLSEGNTGKMQWGNNYRNKHVEIYKELYRLLKRSGILVVNVKDHVRKGNVMPVSDWHKDTLLDIGFTLEECVKIPVKGNGYGSNSHIRVDHENIFLFTKNQ